MWEAIINNIVYPRARAAARLGLEEEELRGVACVAALEAQKTWRPDGGATASSWVWTHVSGVVAKTIYRAGRELADDTAAEDLEDGEAGPETVAIIREALGVLKARLDPSDYRLLWMVHAMGFTAAELADLHLTTPEVMRKRLSRAKERSVTILTLAA